MSRYSSHDESSLEDVLRNLQKWRSLLYQREKRELLGAVRHADATPISQPSQILQKVNRKLKSRRKHFSRRKRSVSNFRAPAKPRKSPDIWRMSTNQAKKETYKNLNSNHDILDEIARIKMEGLTNQRRDIEKLKQEIAQMKAHRQMESMYAASQGHSIIPRRDMARKAIDTLITEVEYLENQKRGTIEKDCTVTPPQRPVSSRVCHTIKLDPSDPGYVDRLRELLAESEIKARNRSTFTSTPSFAPQPQISQPMREIIESAPYDNASQHQNPYETMRVQMWDRHNLEVDSEIDGSIWI